MFFSSAHEVLQKVTHTVLLSLNQFPRIQVIQNMLNQKLITKRNIKNPHIFEETKQYASKQNPPLKLEIFELSDNENTTY